MNGLTSYILSKKYVESTADSLGSLKGAPCTIKSQTETDDSYIVTFEWTGTSGAKETSQLTIKKPKDGVDGLPGTNGKDGQPGKDGSDGIGILKIEKIGTVDLVDTYRITFTDNSTFDYEVKNGKDGQGGGTVDAPIESISVNGVNVAIDENKNVDITVPSITGLATETYVDNKVADYTKTADLADVATSGSYNDLADKPTIPSLDGYAKTSEIPSKVSELENDSNYLSSIPEEYVTETELEAKGYLTEHQDISGKVDKVEGKSLISDTEIARLASVDNYDDTDIKAEIAKKADATAIPSKVSELTNDSNYQTAEQVNSTVTTEIAKVVADAPEDLNTLKEMSDWIAGHEDDASAMNSAISDNKTAITALQTGKADKSEIPTTVAELTDSADYAKTTDIPTTLPANGGNADTVNNHTVETDVPVDAEFTDTIYDDTEVKGSIAELSSNLDGLGYGENGAKNLFKGYDVMRDCTISSETYNGYPIIYSNKKWYGAYQSDLILKSGVTYTISAYVKGSGYACCFNSLDKQINQNTIVLTDNFERFSFVYTPKEDVSKIRIENSTDSDLYIACFQIEEGDTATPYKPYIPSVKMLADENAQQSSNLDGLGYGENGAKNLFEDEIKWIEKITVERGTKSVSDGKITLTATSDDCYTHHSANTWKNSGIKTIPCKPNTTYTLSWEYEGDSIGDVYIFENGSTNNIGYTINKSHKLLITTSADAEYLTVRVGVRNSGTSITYWNFQLEEGDTATPYEPYIPSIKMLAEEVGKQNDSLSVIGKCKNLLNPTLQTTTLNEVTCTANGDGTYTLNGTASSDVVFELESYKSYTGKEKFRLVGCPNGGGKDKYYLAFRPNNAEENRKDIGSGVTFNDLSTSNKYAVAIIVLNGTTVTNLTFKPMLTENLNATFEDFVPYTGDGETLTHDVAKLNENLGAYGLDNKCVEIVQGSIGSTGSDTEDENRVKTKDYLYVPSGSIVTVKTSMLISYTVWNESKTSVIFSSEWLSSDIAYEATQNCYVRIKFKKSDDSNCTPSQVGHVGVYINNAIDKLKNDLSTKIYELAGSELYLCVSGKICILTLNGYNLTGSTNFSKLAEYPPYLVARNVVAKEDGVCIFSVDPNGNIGASDLQVASSVTGKMFGEVSWVANI